MPTFANPQGMDLTNLGIQGLRIYFQEWDAATSTYKADLLDLGVVENLTPNRESNETNIEGARNGVRNVVKVLTTSVTETATFDSLNFADPAVRGLFEGTGGVTAVNNTKATVFVRKNGASVQGRLIVLRPGAPNTDSSMILVPKVQLKGTQETESNGSEPQKLGFEATFLSDGLYKVPAAVDAATPSAPYGVSVLLEASADPIADLHAMIDALIAA